MSRTYRRNKEHLIRRVCGTLEEARSDPSWIMRRAQQPTVERAYVKKVNLFTGDNHSGLFAAPRWWVRMYYTRPNRHASRACLHTCLRQGDWDGHQDPPNKGATWFYFWQM